MKSLKSRKWMNVIGLIVALSLALAACAPAATPTVAPAEPTSAPAEPTTAAEQPTAAAEQPTEAPTAAPVETGPKPGGTLMYPVQVEPSSLDSSKTAESIADGVMQFIGAALISKDKDNNYVPWLAKSWEASPDGMTWTFHLRDDVKFQDGTPFTAKDYVYTFERALDPETKSPVAGQMISTVDKVTAPDDYTFVVNLKEPYYFFIDNLVSAGYLMPLSKAWVEKYGDKYATNPMSVGPYKLKEWKTGDRIVLERNPDYKWAPAFAHQGPAYLDQIVFRIIPELATQVAGLEAGELDYASIDPQYLDRIKATNKFQIFEAGSTGLGFVAINNAKWPFDDLKVRQAFNYATDRQTIIDVVLKGTGFPAFGPMTPAMTGYDPNVEKFGYGFDLEKAKALMAEAGWKAGADGILAKDGKPLKFDLGTLSSDTRMAEVLKEQWKELGADISIKQEENATSIGNVIKGDYVADTFAYAWPNADILWMVFHSKQEGVLNTEHVNNPDLDKQLDLMRTETDPAKQVAAQNEAQKIIVDNAYLIPVYVPTIYAALASKFSGAYFSPKNNNLYLEDVYLK